VMHLRQLAVSTFDGRCSPLQGLGTLRHPRLPIHEPIERQLPGARRRLTRGLHGLQCLEHLGSASRATRAGRVLLPRQQRRPHGFNPSPPHQRAGHGLHIVLTPPLPPQVLQAAPASELRVDFVHRLLCARPPIRCHARFKRFTLGLPLAGHGL